MNNSALFPLFFIEWLVMSIYISIVCPSELVWAWNLFVVWITIGAIPLLLYAVYKEDKKKKRVINDDNT